MQSKLEAKYLREIGEKVYSFFFENPEMENNNLEFREGQSEMACEIVDAISQKKKSSGRSRCRDWKIFCLSSATYLLQLLFTKTSGNSYFNYHFAGTITRRYTLYHGEITNISRSFIG